MLFAAALLVAGTLAMAQEGDSQNPKDTEVWTPGPPSRAGRRSCRAVAGPGRAVRRR